MSKKFKQRNLEHNKRVGMLPAVEASKRLPNELCTLIWIYYDIAPMFPKLLIVFPDDVYAWMKHPTRFSAPNPLGRSMLYSSEEDDGIMHV